MRNIKLTIAYDGTEYVGWQIQPNGNSVQAEMERAIRELTLQESRMIVAGRTDSGVHAYGQVANFWTNSKIECEQMRKGLQRFLPGDIVVRKVEEAPQDFHSTYSATQKHYRYLIYNHDVKNPMLRRYVTHHPHRLDLELMQEAANYLLGEHDFRCFETQFPNKATSVRTMLATRISRRDEWDLWGKIPGCTGRDHLICFDIVGTGFLYNMVRAIVGTLFKVGNKRWPPERMKEIIDNQERALAGETAPPTGLYLMEVNYDQERQISLDDSEGLFPLVAE